MKYMFGAFSKHDFSHGPTLKLAFHKALAELYECLFCCAYSQQIIILEAFIQGKYKLFLNISVFPWRECEESFKGRFAEVRAWGAAEPLPTAGRGCCDLRCDLMTGFRHFVL